VTRALRSNHADVDALGRGDVAEADVEAVGEEQRVAGDEVGAISSAYSFRWTWSGARIMIRSASSTASATERTRRPSAAAFSRDGEPSLRPTRTSTPESRRLSALRVTCEP